MHPTSILPHNQSLYPGHWCVFLQLDALLVLLGHCFTREGRLMFTRQVQSIEVVSLKLATLQSPDAASKYLLVSTLLAASAEYLDGLEMSFYKDLVLHFRMRPPLDLGYLSSASRVTMVTRCRNPNDYLRIPDSMQFPVWHGAALPLRLTSLYTSSPSSNEIHPIPS